MRSSLAILKDDERQRNAKAKAEAEAEAAAEAEFEYWGDKPKVFLESMDDMDDDDEFYDRTNRC